jgi:hypothetical protein
MHMLVDMIGSHLWRIDEGNSSSARAFPARAGAISFRFKESEKTGAPGFEH